MAALCGAATWWFFIAPFNAFKLDVSTFVALGFDVFVAWVEMARSGGLTAYT